MQVVWPPPRPSSHLSLYLKHSGHCTCTWCIKDSLFWNSTHGFQCNCKWCLLDIKRVRATGTNAPKDLFYSINNQHFVSGEVQDQSGNSRQLTSNHTHECTLTKRGTSTHASQSSHQTSNLLISTHSLEISDVSSTDLFNDLGYN